MGLRLDKTQHGCPGSVEVDGKMPLAQAKSDLSLLSFSETELNPPPLFFFFFSLREFNLLLFYQGLNLKSEVIFYLDMLI